VFRQIAGIFLNTGLRTGENLIFALLAFFLYFKILYANTMPNIPLFHFSTVFSAILPINVLTKPAQMK